MAASPLGPKKPVSPGRRHFQALRLRITVLLLLAGLVPLIGLGASSAAVFGRLFTEKSENILEMIAQGHAQTIDLFLAERLKALTLVAMSYEKEALIPPGRLNRVFDLLNQSHPDSFQDLGVIDSRGRHLAYVGPFNLMDKNYSDTPWFARVREEGSYISDVFMGYRKIPHFIIAVRRNEPDGGFWILRTSINSDVFDRLVSQGRLGSTGDCFILDREGRYQTPPKEGGRVLDPSGIQERTTRGKASTFSVRAREVDIIRTMQWIKNGEWLVVVQQNADEAHAPVRTAMKNGLTIFALGAVVIVLTSFWTTRRLIRMLEKSTRQEKLLDQQLLQASKLASVGELTTGVAHEINNPLAIIYAEQTNLRDLLSMMDGNDPDVQEMLESVARTCFQIDRCKTITHKMLQFGRQGFADPQIVDPAAELREITSLLRRQAEVNNVDLCLEMEEPLPKVRIQPVELQQVLTNLINNGIQAIDGRRGAVVVSAYASESRLRIAVEDTGPGIPPDALDKIFEPFFTTKPVGKGTGLGLSVCFGIVTKWQGRIWAESTPGSGAVLYFDLPVVS